MAYCKTVQGAEVRKECRSPDDVHLRPRRQAADAEPDGAENRLFRMTPSTLLEGLLKAGGRLQRHLVDAG